MPGLARRRNLHVRSDRGHARLHELQRVLPRDSAAFAPARIVAFDSMTALRAQVASKPEEFGRATTFTSALHVHAHAHVHVHTSKYMHMHMFTCHVH